MIQPERQRNRSVRPLLGTLIVLALGYYDWTLYRRLATLRLLESGTVTRQRINDRIDALNRQAAQLEAQADARARPAAPALKP